MGKKDLPEMLEAQTSKILTQAGVLAATGTKLPTHLRDAHPGFELGLRLILDCLLPFFCCVCLMASLARPFNWGGAHCAGEIVKQTERTIPTEVSKSTKKNKTAKQQNGHSPPRQPGTPRPRSQVHGPRSKRPKEHKRLQRQIQVRLNVHRNALKKALIAATGPYWPKGARNKKKP